MLWWFQRIARNGSGAHRDVIVVSDGPSGLVYTRIDAEGASSVISPSDIGVIAQEKTAKFPLFTALLVLSGLLSVAMFSALPWLAALAFTVVMAMALVPLYNWQRRTIGATVGLRHRVWRMGTRAERGRSRRGGVGVGQHSIARENGGDRTVRGGAPNASWQQRA